MSSCPGLTWAVASLDAPVGTIRVRWGLDDAAVRLEADIPCDCTAVSDVLGRGAILVGAGHHAVIGTLESAPEE
jgi:hypothetical protein